MLNRISIADFGAVGNDPRYFLAQNLFVFSSFFFLASWTPLDPAGRRGEGADLLVEFPLGSLAAMIPRGPRSAKTAVTRRWTRDGNLRRIQTA